YGTRGGAWCAFFFSGRRRHTRFSRDWSSDVCSSDLVAPYAQIRVDVLENLIFKGGVRYENATVNVKDFNTIASGPDGEGSIFVRSEERRVGNECRCRRAACR